MKFALCFAAGLLAIAVGCSAAPTNEETDSTDDSLSLSDFEAGESVRMMPMHAAEDPSATSDLAAAPSVTPPAGAHLTYFGGPVLSNVKVVAVYWGPGVATSMQTHLNAFYPAITKSAYFDWLHEYNTPTQTIGRGSFGGAVTITPAKKGTKLTDVSIQKEIASQIKKGALPASDADTVYMIHFPPGITITQGGSSSCAQFCAYHGTFKQSSKMVFYGVIPDQGGACAGGCGPSPVADGTTDVASHELIEAVTDPAVGLAKSNAPPLGWYDPTNGEIGDICSGQNDNTPVAGFQVQVEWSNARKACVAK